MLNVTIPYYNSASTLPKTLDPLIAQTSQKFLVTIIDDGTKDDAIKDIVEEYSKRLRITCIRSLENGGPGYARQIGIDNCPCEY